VSARRGVAAALAAAATATAVALAAPGASGSAPPQSTAQAAANAQNAFALALLPRLAAGNVVYSPYSIAAALAMAGAGAHGATRSQIVRTLGAATPGANLANVKALRGALDAAVHSGADAPTLDVANSLWTQRTLPIEPPFVATLRSDFGAAPYRADFATAPDGARQTINRWVSQHTAGIIPAVLPEGSITTATRFVLANAIYLKAHWANPFDKSSTRTLPFTTAAHARVNVPFMTAGAAYPYAGGRHFQAVDLPYASSTLSLLAILPVGEQLDTLERGLTAATLATVANELKTTDVDLRLPKLHLRTQLSLNSALQELGMTEAFTPDADFSGITRAARLQIGLVEHAADLRLDEEGTVAAGATVVVGPTAIAQPVGRPVTVNLDRPFLLLLREDTSGAILFVAQVDDPSAG
jgi:serpin B